jgi:hypothetical protein
MLKELLLITYLKAWWCDVFKACLTPRVSFFWFNAHNTKTVAINKHMRKKYIVQHFYKVLETLKCST